MIRTTIRIWLWRLRHVRYSLAWPYLLSASLLAVAGIVYWGWIKRGEERLSILTDELETFRHREAAISVEARPLSTNEQLEAFYAFFPENDAQADVLDRIFAAADKQNLALPQGDYQWLRESSGRLVRYGIVLPLRGTYPGIRRFIAQVLKDNPPLALDAVSFGRQAISDDTVEALVRFTLFLRENGP